MAESVAKTVVSIGCGLILLVVLVVGGVIGFGVKKGMNYVNTYTETTPVKLESAQVPEADVKELIAKTDEFVEAAKAGTAKEPLELTAEDLNILLQNYPPMAKFKDHALFSMEDDQLRVKASIPLGDFVPIFRDKYLNAEVALKSGYGNGILSLRPESIELKGEPVSDQMLKEFQSGRYNIHIQNYLQLQKLMTLLDHIEIKEGQVFLFPRKP